MVYILNIETATKVCSVGVSYGEEVLVLRESTERNIHAVKTTVFIEEVLAEAGIGKDKLSAVAVSKGPGSYTGLRIGTSVAKGLCYALDIPLIAISTLEAMAFGAAQKAGKDNDLYCPMIDARRMEVYCAFFNKQIEIMRDTNAEVIDGNSFTDISAGRKVWYFGDGAPKCREVFSQRPEMTFLEDLFPSASYMAPISNRAYMAKEFADTAYFEPFYLKEFIPGKPKIKGLD
jgi:tRNA threonylcarbamoyladenosine biosynthesis protein TsaB